MGIPSCRFTDRLHEQFLCPVCLDVAEDPVVVTNCEHIFCKKCVDIESIANCPSCQEPLTEPKWGQMKGGLKRIYFHLRVKCLNPSCGHDMDISNFKEHDTKCPITFEFCKECGLKSRRGAGNEHSCIQVIKDHYEGKLEQLEQKMEGKMAKMKEQLDGTEEKTKVKVELKMKKEMEQKLTIMKKQLEQMKQDMEQNMAKMKKEQSDGTEEKLKKERQRYEDFIALAVTARNEFDDWEISDMDPDDVRKFRNPNYNFDTSKQIGGIKAIIDKM